MCNKPRSHEARNGMCAVNRLNSYGCAGDEVAVVCNPIRMGRWSELMVVRVCHSDEVMREADANDTSG